MKFSIQGKKSDGFRKCRSNIAAISLASCSLTAQEKGLFQESKELK